MRKQEGIFPVGERGEGRRYAGEKCQGNCEGITVLSVSLLIIHGDNHMGRTTVLDWDARILISDSRVQNEEEDVYNLARLEKYRGACQ